MPNMSVCLSSNIIVLLILINSWSSFFHLVRTNLQISLSFMILGILVTFAGVVFVFPLWHRGFFLVGFVCGVLGGKLNWVNNPCYTSCYFPLISCSSFCPFHLPLIFLVLSYSAVFYSITLGVFLETDMDYAGFFSVNGQSSSGCLGTSFGLAIGSFAINLMGSLVAALAFFYKNLAKKCRSKKEWTTFISFCWIKMSPISFVSQKKW